MIVKRIPNPKSSSSKASRVGSLLDYIAADGHQEAEKAEYIATCGGFISDSFQGCRAEMIALAEEATRSKDPVDHWLLSWKEGEQPTQMQCREAVEVLKKHLGMNANHLAVYALHRNTDNYHLHIVLNRVHPETLRVSDKGWCIDRAHKALAEIVQVQGWEAEQNARYGGDSAQLNARPQLEHRAEPGTRARDYENATGEKSAERISIEQAAPILGDARSWSEAHERLRQVGMRYEQKGSGALLWVGKIAIKASACGREFSRKRMEERLGALEADGRPFKSNHAMNEVRPLDQNTTRKLAEYRTALRQYRAEKEAAQTAQRAAHRAEHTKQCQEFRAERAGLNKGAQWSGAALNVARSLLAADHAKRRAALSERQKRQRNELRQRFGNRLTYEEFLKARGDEQLAENWRYRQSATQTASICGDGEALLQRCDIRDFIAEVQYSGKEGIAAIHYHAKYTPDRISFTDRGRRIDIWQQQDEAAILAALQLGAQKWGVVTVTGPDEFKHLCASLAAQHGIQIDNPELNVQPQRTQRTDGQATNAPPKPASAYLLHKADILNRVAVRNASQLDWMIAVRMRVTGYDQHAVAQAIEAQAPQGRAAENRNWKNYACRTASAAFGPRGDRECLHCKLRASTWARVEGREPVLRITRTRDRGHGR